MDGAAIVLHNPSATQSGAHANTQPESATNEIEAAVSNKGHQYHHLDVQPRQPCRTPYTLPHICHWN